MELGQRAEKLLAFLLEVCPQLQMQIAHSEGIADEVGRLGFRESSLGSALLHDLLHGDVQAQVGPDLAVHSNLRIHVLVPKLQQGLAKSSNLGRPPFQLGALFFSLEHRELAEAAIPL